MDKKTTLPVTTLLEPDLIEKLDKECNKQNRNRSNMINYILRMYFEKKEQ